MVKLGFECKLFRGSAGVRAATEVKGVESVTVNLTKGEVDITTRAANGWKIYAGALKDASIEVNIPNDPESADYQVFQSAYINNTAISIFATDGSGTGLDCDVVITGFTQDQPLEDKVVTNVTMRPTMLVATSGGTARAPQWVTSATSGGSSTVED